MNQRFHGIFGHMTLAAAAMAFASREPGPAHHSTPEEDADRLARPMQQNSARAKPQSESLQRMLRKGRA